MNSSFIELSTNIHIDQLLKTEALFDAKKKQWFSAFAEHFNSICIDIVKMQNESELPAITYIDYTLLFNNFYNKRYVAEIWLYGDKSYLDKSQRIIGEYDISFLFIYFGELWDKLLSLRKLFVGKVRALEVVAFMMQALPDFFSYLADIARFSIAEFVDKSLLANINKNKLFRINVGSYLAKTENVYIERKNKNVDKLAMWFSERLENKYTFEDFSGLDFSGHFFTFTEFRYSQFRNACLNNVSLKGCALIGTNFQNAQMENCCLDNCSIYEADFSHAYLKNASFVKARGRAGLPNPEKWQHVGFLPVNFRYADLTNANFTGANLCGADFTGAVLDGTIFTDAILNGAIFDDKYFFDSYQAL